MFHFSSCYLASESPKPFEAAKRYLAPQFDRYKDFGFETSFVQSWLNGYVDLKVFYRLSVSPFKQVIQIIGFD